MKSILEKLTSEEIKELSKAINETQKEFFGNPLGLRKQEEFMSKVFKKKNWNTVLGISKKKYDPSSEYQKTTICIEVLSNKFYDFNDLSQVNHDIIQGDCSGQITHTERESLSKEEMKQALMNQGSDPSFLVQLSEVEISYLDSIYDQLNNKLKYNHNLEEMQLEDIIALMQKLIDKDGKMSFDQEELIEYFNC